LGAGEEEVSGKPASFGKPNSKGCARKRFFAVKRCATCPFFANPAKDQATQDVFRAEFWAFYGIHLRKKRGAV
jgi:hypothetical protein